MRGLFESERKLVTNMVRAEMYEAVPIVVGVAIEVYGNRAEGKGVCFNQDFCINFEQQQKPDKYKTIAVPVLPSTLGVDLFLTLNPQSKQPKMLELLGGAGLPMRYFDQFVSEVDSLLSGLQSCAVTRLKKAQAVRMFVAYDMIYVLASYDSLEFSPRGEKKNVIADVNCAFDVYSVDGKTTLIDGWLQTYAPKRGSTLEIAWVPGDEGGDSAEQSHVTWR
jgi:hypothetical protein